MYMLYCIHRAFQGKISHCSRGELKTCIKYDMFGVVGLKIQHPVLFCLLYACKLKRALK